MEKKIKLGCKARDKITGFEGIVVARIKYLFGCTQYAIMPKWIEGQKTEDSEYFDVGRLEVIGEGISKEDVQAKEKVEKAKEKVEKDEKEEEEDEKVYKRVGGINRDRPKKKYNHG